MSYTMNPLMSIKNKKLSAAADTDGALKGKGGEGLDNDGGGSGGSSGGGGGGGGGGKKEENEESSSSSSQPLLRILREALSSEREAREAMRTELSSEREAREEAMRTEFDEKLALLSGHRKL
jgi:hypothetical protein